MLDEQEEDATAALDAIAPSARTWSFVNGGWRPGDLAFADKRWFDITGGTAELLALAERFHLHPLAVEDCLSTRLHAPKFDDFTTYSFLVFQAPVPGSGGEGEMEELDVFLSESFLITYRDRPIPWIDGVHAQLEQGAQPRPGTDGLLYEVLDRCIDAVLPVVETIADELDLTHERVLEGSGQSANSHAIVALRARAGHLRRVLTPQLNVVQRLSRGELAQIAPENRIYYRDVYDHLVRVDLSLEAVREDAEVVLSTYLAALNNRLSEVMKVLSVVAALALPATVISGIFGTNFDNVPGLHSNWGFVIMLVGMTGLAGGMATYFWRRGWF